MAGWLLPDPFVSADGRRIARVSQWPGQRHRLLAMLDRVMYGIAPDPPSIVSEADGSSSRTVRGMVSDRVLRLAFGLGAHGYELPVRVLSPVERERPWIPIVMIGPVPSDHVVDLLARRGCALVVCDATGLVPDDPAGFARAPLIVDTPACSWRAIRAWAWLESRVIDWLAGNPQFDPERIVVVGHSRYGKAALCCAAHDERVAVCAPVGSGCAGMGSLRCTGGRFGKNIGEFERIGQMCTSFPHWLLPEIGRYGSTDGGPYHEDRLPFDAHTIASCIAPRRLIVCEGLDDPFNNVYGTQAAWLAAGQAWRFLDAEGNIGLRLREGGHELCYDDWETILDFTLGHDMDGHARWRTIRDDDPPLERDWQPPTTTR